MSKSYEDVYETQDFDTTGMSAGRIQWKGTDVCIDLYCICGYHGHFDGEFFYYYECPNCHTKFAVGQNVKLIPLNDSQIKEVEEERNGFCTCKLE